MHYFKDHYHAIRYPEATDSAPGLRRPQIGAVHAIAAHFTRHSKPEETKPAIVVMPTGSGKTAVLMLSAFILKAERALVITPSDLVRAQVANQFRSLAVLRETGALAGEPDLPAVQLVDTKLKKKADWLALETSDVVVSTPNCASPAQKGVAVPPQDLFDLLLIDEAHHVPAKTWTAILEAFPNAKKVLFTATPFRHDEQEIHGELVYEFSIREAYLDRIFGELQFIPVDLTETPDADLAIARAAETVLRQDQQAGLDHYLLVRTDTRVHAKELQKVYAENTGLNLRLIHSHLSPSTVDQAVELLLQKKLDGIICVDMLGEGFDFPNLKIAAIHRPHKSFPVTLQFIGRFARTGDEKIGQAKFLAVPQEIRIDMEQLYKEGKVWQEIVPDLYQSRILEGQQVRQDLATFEPLSDDVLADLSLDDFTPLQHVKIYRLPGGADLDVEIALKEVEVIKQYRSEALSALLFITMDVEIPDWSSTEVFKQVSYDLFVLYYDALTRLLFINSSRRLDSLYDEIAGQVARPAEKGIDFKPVPVWEVNRVLRSLKGPCFFNIGMVNRLAGSYSESYRIIAGPRAQRALLRSDGRTYRRGHIYGRGQGEEDETRMLGYSSSARVWSNRTETVPGLVAWCRALAEEISRAGPVTTGSGLDDIPIPEPLKTLPQDIWFAGWHEKVFLNPPQVMYALPASQPPEQRECSLLDLDLQILSITDSSVRVSLNNAEINWQVDYLPFGYPFFQEVPGNSTDLLVKRGFLWVGMADYLNDHPLQFLTTRQSVVQADGITRYDLTFDPFDPLRIDVHDWDGARVNIQYEFGPPVSSNGKDLFSIHDHLKGELKASDAQVVFYDHASGEIADFLTFRLSQEELKTTLYHVKASGGKNPGARVGDVYEVSGQVVKSLVWLREDLLLERIDYRRVRGHPFIKGNLKLLRKLFADADTDRIPLCFEIAIVQPGISQEAVAGRPAILELLASADDYLNRCSCSELRVIASE